MADPVTWRDVALALTGAPVGALIAVGGVHLTNRHNQENQRAALEAQANQHRAQLEFDLRSTLQQQTLATRSQLYEELLSECERATTKAAWATGNELPDDTPPLANEDLHSMQNRVADIRFRVLVHCSAPVRYEVEQFADAVASVDETSSTAQWNSLIERAEALQQCVVQAAVIDRSGGVAEDGLGGM